MAELAVHNNVNALLRHLCERPVYARTRTFLRQVAMISTMRGQWIQSRSVLGRLRSAPNSPLTDLGRESEKADILTARPVAQLARISEFQDFRFPPCTCDRITCHPLISRNALKRMGKRRIGRCGGEIRTGNLKT
jgi:hypothetical protein